MEFQVRVPDPHVSPLSDKDVLVCVCPCATVCIGRINYGDYSQTISSSFCFLLLNYKFFSFALRLTRGNLFNFNFFLGFSKNKNVQMK